MVRASVLGDRALDEFPGVADGYEQQKARNELAYSFEDAERLRLRECDACCHFLSFSSVEFFAEFVCQGLKPRGLKLFFAAVETAAYNDGMKGLRFIHKNVSRYHGMCLITPSQTSSESASDRATAQVSSESLDVELLFDGEAEFFFGVDCVVMR